MGRMYTSIQFIAHLWQAKRWDAFHSPYLFDLFTYCCDETKRSATFTAIEIRRKALLSSTEEIKRMDFGAGSLSGPNTLISSVSAIAQNALSHPFQCRFLYRMAEFLQPNRILEFGTSLGISVAYLSAGNPAAAIDTVEGDPEVARLANNTLDTLGFINVSVFSSTFQAYIDTSLDQKGEIDLLFLDGHHTSEALLTYYRAIKHKLHAGSIFVVDDIYWSEDMRNGWMELIQYPEVTQSVDCFHFGLIFFKPEFIGQENHKISLPLRMLLVRG